MIKATTNDRYVAIVGYGMVAAAMLAAYSPLLVEFSAWQWSRPHYQHFPFVIAAGCGLLAYRWFNAIERQLPQSNWLMTGALLTAGWLILLGAIVLHSPMFAAISAVLMLGGACAIVSRSREVPYLWGVWFLFWLVIPLPLGMDRELISFLQRGSSWLSSISLDGLGVLHLMEGNVLALPDKQLFVDEACSGIVSIISIVACAAILGVWKNRAPIHVLLLACAGIGWATLLNVLRITIIAFTYDRFQCDLSNGWSHELLSLVLFGVTFGALVASDQLLLGCITPIAEHWEETTGHTVHYGRLFVAAWDKLVCAGAPLPIAYPVAVRGQQDFDIRGSRIVSSRLRSSYAISLFAAFTILTVLQLTLFPVAFLRAASPDKRPNLQRALTMNAATLPRRLGDFEFSKFRLEKRETEHFFGEYSTVYEYVRGESQVALISCDFAFQGGWHELTICYRAVGWQLLSRRIVSPSDNDGETWEYVEADFRKSDGQYATVLFCEFGEIGRPVPPAGETLSDGIRGAFARRGQATDYGDCYQVQILLSSPAEVSSDHRAAGRTALLAAREVFRHTVVQDAAGTVPHPAAEARSGANTYARTAGGTAIFPLDLSPVR